MTDQPFCGVLAPVLTPFAADLSPDVGRFTAFCRWLLAQGADGLAVLVQPAKRTRNPSTMMILLDSLIESGAPGDNPCWNGRLVDRRSGSLEQTRCGLRLRRRSDVAAVLLQGRVDDGLFAWFSAATGRRRCLKIYLYHIPPQTGTPFSLDLIGRLIKEYPNTVVGLKDSGGDWSNTKAILDAFPGFGTFAGSEVFLLDTLRGGGVGCITATGNVNPTGIRKVFENWETPEADALQAAITKTRKTIQARTLVPALKAIISHYHSDPEWGRLMPPMVPLSAEGISGLIADLDADEGFSIAPATLENAAE